MCWSHSGVQDLMGFRKSATQKLRAWGSPIVLTHAPLKRGQSPHMWWEWEIRKRNKRHNTWYPCILLRIFNYSWKASHNFLPQRIFSGHPPSIKLSRWAWLVTSRTRELRFRNQLLNFKWPADFQISYRYLNQLSISGHQLAMSKRPVDFQINYRYPNHISKKEAS